MVIHNKGGGGGEIDHKQWSTLALGGGGGDGSHPPQINP